MVRRRDSVTVNDLTKPQEPIYQNQTKLKSMKMKLPLLTAAACLLAFRALADDANPMPSGMGQSDRLTGAVKASDVIGLEVQNYQHEKLGKVNDLALDVESGRVVQVIIAANGYNEQDGVLLAVPPAAFHHDVANHVLHLNVTGEKFMAGPRLNYSNWDESNQSNEVRMAYGYYDVPPYFVPAGDAYWTNSMLGTLAGTLPRNMDGTVNTTGARPLDTAKNIKIVSNWQATNNAMAARNADGSWNQQYTANASWSRLGHVQRASKLMGATVKNQQDEKLGTVKNFAVDLAAGRIVSVIISSGGFLGMGHKWSAVPPTAFRSNLENENLQLNVSKEMLAASPRFTDAQWNDLGQPAYVSGIYHTYNEQPYFNPDATAADNTRRNTQDRDGRTLTPLDQGNRQADIDTTVQIRKEIIANENMSINAKNVKIITRNGHVTLRGAVNSPEEKQLIGEIADRSAHAGTVDNQLEVTTTSSRN